MEKDLLTGVLAKTLNKSPEEISELLYNKSDDSDELVLKEDAQDLVLGLDADRIASIKTSTRPSKEELKKIRDQHIKEIMGDFEKSLKNKYGIESASKGLDLVQEIIDQVSECDISEDKVKTHPLYLQLEETRTKDDYEALETEFNEFKSNLERNETLSKIKRDVLTIFSSLNPIESETAAVAQTRRDDFLRKFDKYDFEVSEDGNHFVKQNGARLEDRHGNPIKFQDFVTNIASLNYDFANGTEKGNAGNDGQNGSGSRTDVPKTEKEYLALMAEYMRTGDREKAAKLQAAWVASQQN
jgi:hypothetical protein